MRRRTKILAGGIALAFLAFAVWLTIWPAKPVFQARLVRVLDDGSQWVLTVIITNRSSHAIVSPNLPGQARAAGEVELQSVLPEVEWQTRGSNNLGRLIRQRATMVNGTFVFDEGFRKDPHSGKMAWLPNTTLHMTFHHGSWGGHSSRVRFQVEVRRDAGSVRRAVGQVVRKLPRNRLPKSVSMWLWRNGLLDGQMIVRSDTPWLTIPTENPPGSVAR